MCARRWLFLGVAVALGFASSIGRAQGPAAAFHGIGQLPGGPALSFVADATSVSGTIYAVGMASKVGIIDTPFLWDSVNGFTELPPGAATATTPFLGASSITPDARYIASTAHNTVAHPSFTSAVRVTRTGLSLVNTFLDQLGGLNNGAGTAVAISDLGLILYGTTLTHAFGNPSLPGPVFDDGYNRTIRFDLNAPSAALIPALPGMTQSAPAARGVSREGSIVVGTSWNAPYDRFFFGSTNGRAFRYDNATGV